MAKELLSVAMQSGEFTLASAVHIFEVFAPDGAFVGVIQRESDGWLVPSATIERASGKFRTAESAVSELVNRASR